MQRRVPFLLIARRWLRRTTPAPPRAPASEPPSRRPFLARKDRDRDPGLRLLKPDQL